MLTRDEADRIEDATGIAPEQLRRLEKVATVQLRRPVEVFQASATRRPFFGCPSEAH